MAEARTCLQESLLGTWTLSSYVIADVSGENGEYPLGEDAHGLLIYTAEGFTSVQISTPAPGILRWGPARGHRRGASRGGGLPGLHRSTRPDVGGSIRSDRQRASNSSRARSGRRSACVTCSTNHSVSLSASATLHSRTPNA